MRLSLGASSSDLRRGIIAEGLQVAFYGVVCGAFLAFALGRLLANVLFEVPSNGPLSYLLATVIILILGLIASVGPALSTRHVLPREIVRALAR